MAVIKRLATWLPPRFPPACLVRFDVAVKGVFKVRERDDKPGPSVKKTTFEHVVFHERPYRMSQRAAHRQLAVFEFFGAQGGIAVGFLHHLGHVLERELPNGLTHHADGLI